MSFFLSPAVFRFDTSDAIVQWIVPFSGAYYKPCCRSPLAVTSSGPYSILAVGAQGGSDTQIGSIGGFGASMRGVFDLVANDTLSILVGHTPAPLVSGYWYHQFRTKHSRMLFYFYKCSAVVFPGGGGGTYVAFGADFATSTPLIVAGGGGGASSGIFVLWFQLKVFELVR